MSETQVSLICPTCRASCDVIHEHLYCDNCWYGVCGGDLAPDEALASRVTMSVVEGTIHWHHYPSMSP